MTVSDPLVNVSDACMPWEEALGRATAWHFQRPWWAYSAIENRLRCRLLVEAREKQRRGLDDAPGHAPWTPPWSTAQVELLAVAESRLQLYIESLTQTAQTSRGVLQSEVHD